MEMYVSLNTKNTQLQVYNLIHPSYSYLEYLDDLVWKLRKKDRVSNPGAIAINLDSDRIVYDRDENKLIRTDFYDSNLGKCSIINFFSVLHDYFHIKKAYGSRIAYLFSPLVVY